MAKLKVNWQEYFYNEKYNPAIPFIKKSCHWIFLNVPDLSFLMGWKRRVAGICFLFIVIYFTGLMLLGEITLWSFFLRTAAITSIAMVLYIKIIAYMSLMYIEAYQKKAKKVLNRK